MGKKAIHKEAKGCAASKKTSKGDSEGLTKQKIFNKWAACAPQECTSCEQTTHQIDRDAPDNNQHYVMWCKTNPAPTKRDPNAVKPSGYECYKCMDVRRTNFPGVTQKELIEKNVA